MGSPSATGGGRSNRHARGYKAGARVKDPFRLRVNAYRVLLTRARDTTVVFAPPVQLLDETYRFLGECGFAELE